MVCLGASGFSYSDWAGNFYPAGRPEGYDYGYTPLELGGWLAKIQGLDGVTEKTFISANSHWRGQAVSTISQLRVMLN